MDYQERYNELIEELKASESLLKKLSQKNEEKSIEYNSRIMMLNDTERTLRCTKESRDSMVSKKTNNLYKTICFGGFLIAYILFVKIWLPLSGTSLLGVTLFTEVIKSILLTLLDVGIVATICYVITKNTKKFIINKVKKSTEYTKQLEDIEDLEQKKKICEEEVVRVKKEFELATNDYYELNTKINSIKTVIKYFEDKIIGTSANLEIEVKEAKPYTKVLEKGQH